jgi:hypothetical protein
MACDGGETERRSEGSEEIIGNIQHIKQIMYLRKHNLWQVLISYLFRYRGAIFGDSFRSQDYKPNTLL